MLQGCALALPGGPWCLAFVLGWLENLCLFFFFNTNHMLANLDFTGSEHWGHYNFP